MSVSGTLIAESLREGTRIEGRAQVYRSLIADRTVIAKLEAVTALAKNLIDGCDGAWFVLVVRGETRSVGVGVSHCVKQPSASYRSSNSLGAGSRRVLHLQSRHADPRSIQRLVSGRRVPCRGHGTRRRRLRNAGGRAAQPRVL